MKKFTILLGCLLFAAAQAQTGDLSGQWKMVGWTLPDYVPIKGKLPDFLFKDGKVSGLAGCNTFNGTYEVEGGQITFGEFTTTRMACDEFVMKQEQTFLKALSGQTMLIEVVKDSLTLTDGSGYMLNIRRSTLQPKN